MSVKLNMNLTLIFYYIFNICDRQRNPLEFDIPFIFSNYFQRQQAGFP